MTALARRRVAKSLRSATDKRVMEVVAAFERQYDAESGAKSVDGFLTYVLSTDAERFVIPAPWPVEALRNILLAFLLNAPDEDLDDIVIRSRNEQAMMDAFARGEEYWGDEQAVSP